MIPELKTLLASAEGQKRELLARIDAMPEAQRLQSRPRQWSPLQTIEHLVRFEEDMVRWIETADTQTQPGVKASMGSALISATMRAAIPVPAPPRAEPGEPDTLPNLKARWQATRAKLAGCTAAVPLSDKAAFAQHPYLGPVTAMQLLDMLDSHLTYHLRRPPLNAAS